MNGMVLVMEKVMRVKVTSRKGNKMKECERKKRMIGRKVKNGKGDQQVVKRMIGYLKLSQLNWLKLQHENDFVWNLYASRR